MRRIVKPGRDEYAAYASVYMDLVPDDENLLLHLSTNAVVTNDLIAGLSDSALSYRYAEGKWTIKEVLGHLIDDERVYVYRTLRFARNDPTELPGFDQDRFALYSNANVRSIDSLLEEFALVRKCTIAFFNSLDDAALLRFGIGDGKRISVRALGYHIAGHELHHVAILKHRYMRTPQS